MTHYERRRHHMVDAERRRGEIADERVLAAMAEVPRERFVPEDLDDQAYEEHALPIGEGQTISQPYVVALMTDALRLEPDDRVLEVGTGSGYQTAVLRRLVERIVTIERVESLARVATERFAALGLDGIEVVVGDGSTGWAEGAPYDAIVVTAGGPSVPRALRSQLAVGGRLVMPVGPSGAQSLTRITRRTDGLDVVDDLGPVAFVPLIGEEGWKG
jgi:protein-L-isoaspartate(D-aspartate) O-methyltransferase